jgi:hypothetical protein
MFETIAGKNETDSDRKVKFQVALALFAAIVVAILEIWRLASGRTGGRVHLSTLLIALSCFIAITQYKQMLLRVALALIGTQAAIRVILSRTHMSVSWLHIVNVAGLMMQLLGAIMVIFVIVEWFNSSRRESISS